MAGKRALVHSICLFLLPVIVAAFGWTAWTASLLVLLMLLWRWLIVLSTFPYPVSRPSPQLETISASHFVEKVRWNMDLAGIPYAEKPAAGALGAFFAGRTVPRLTLDTGAVRSSIGNSREILRYLWGAYSADPAVDVTHLAPSAERLALEQRLDRHGRHLQVWVYYHLLEDREATLRAWGVSDPEVPAWQRFLLPILFPLLTLLIRKSFRITQEHYEKVTTDIETLLEEFDATLADGRASLLGEDIRNYTDYQFAAMTGLWLQPEKYGGPRGRFVSLDPATMPDPMRADTSRWRERFPRVVDWVAERYAEDR